MSVGTRRGRTSHDFSGSPSDSISAKRSSFSSSFSMGLSEWDGFSELGRQLLHSPAVLPPSLTRELVSIYLRNALMAVRLQRKEKRANLGAHDGHPASRHLLVGRHRDLPTLIASIKSATQATKLSAEKTLANRA